MKKFLAIFLVFIMSFSLVACDLEAMLEDMLPPLPSSGESMSDEDYEDDEDDEDGEDDDRDSEKDN